MISQLLVILIPGALLLALAVFVIPGSRRNLEDREQELRQHKVDQRRAEEAMAEIAARNAEIRSSENQERIDAVAKALEQHIATAEANITERFDDIEQKREAVYEEVRVAQKHQSEALLHLSKRLTRLTRESNPRRLKSH